ncbi:probable BOI-related E3 ubiquitin-protein ligase 3 isoform X2 [Phoenix dactylifera]|uniref:Probable BOI-related E3 ubiquitin-protein ligase 3 isoform X2 n=1 Tax=Phoenix dactylifera TaxID=42345 RepID=A0A8B7C2A8_PHODC|nr:probable BOI-related E3 ubiquitin-protein ligase 3 isoform X2 [Phoenix dactylifera]
MGAAPGDEGSKGWEPRAKWLKEQDFLPMASSHMMAVDFLGTLPLSTGLGLSMDDGGAVAAAATAAAASSGDSLLLVHRFPAIDDEISHELQRQEVEIDRFVGVQGEQMRQAILQKFQLKQLQTLMAIKDKILHKIQEKEAEVEEINKKNVELEEQMKQLCGEVETWQQRAKYNDNMIVSLKFHLQQVLAQGRDSREGCGDSEVDDAASFCKGGDANFQLLGKEKKGMKVMLTCKFCQVNEVCMLLLPCRHLCLCKECDSKLGFCPLCQSSKFIGMEIYM